MKSRCLHYLLGLGVLFLLSGCVVRTYPLTKDRVDQDLTMGNRGYIQGKGPMPPERKPTRTTQVVEIELRSPIKFEKKPKTTTQEPLTMEKPEEIKSFEEEGEGNRGYIAESMTPEVAEPEVVGLNFEKYTVRKGDTLQKISQNFYGTTKKWPRIFEANKDILKGPNKIYVGQVLNIPVESLKEPKQNLK
jgi:nucleoid-associated protein YgaU